MKEKRQDLKELINVVQRLAYTVQCNYENESHEREKIILRLENALLKVERRFLSAKNDHDHDKEI